MEESRSPRRKMMPGRRIFRVKQCKFCEQNMPDINYKNIELLEKFITERGKILPRRISGNCAKHQRYLAQEIRRARCAALLPYVSVEMKVKR